MLLFLYIAACFAIALGSYFFCWSKRDWLLLTLGLAFTLAADYFLILHDRHLIGVAVFCFAHVAYIYRGYAQSHTQPRLALALVGLLLIIVGLMLTSDPIYAITAAYAALFIFNIYVSARHLKRNRALVITGLLLFAACDICVLLFNLPRYYGAPAWLRDINFLIWVFYLPSQALLAVSAVNWRRKQHP